MQPASPDRSHSWLDANEKLWVAALFVLLAIAATWPAITHLSSEIIGQETDAYVHFWNLNWVGSDRLWTNLNNLWTDRLFFPVGTSLTNQNIAWLHALLWAALRPLVGECAAYTLVVILMLALNGYAGYLLARDITGNRLPALLAGFVMLLWPATIDHSNQPNMMTTGLIVMCLLHIRRLVATGSRAEVLKLAFWGTVAAISRIQTLILAIPLVIPFTFFHLKQVGRAKVSTRLAKCVAAGLLAAVLSAPFILPYVDQFLVRNGGSDSPAFTYEIQYANDLIFYILPRLNGLIPAAPIQETAHRMGLYVPFYTAAIGWTVLILAVVAIVSRMGRDRHTRGWAILAAILLCLALGPEPRIVGETLNWRPYSNLYHSTIIPIIREPRRFNVLLSIPLGVLAALGLQSYRKMVGRPKVRSTATAVIFVLIALEFWHLPHPTLPIDDIPEWYLSIADDDEDYGLVYIPMSRQLDETHMLYQLTHGKGLVHAHVSRIPDSAYAFIDQVPLLTYLKEAPGGEPPQPDFDIGLSLDMMHDANVRYAVLERIYVPEETLTDWMAWWPVSPVHQDKDVVVYGTDWRQQMDEITAKPGLNSGAHILDYQITPASTVPAGWVEATVSWYVPRDVPHELCLQVVTPDGQVVNEACDLQVTEMQTPEGNTVPEPSPADTLLQAHGLVQIPLYAEAGNYEVCLQTKPEDKASPRQPGSVCRPVEVIRNYRAPTVDRRIDENIGDSVTLFGTDDLHIGEDELTLRLTWYARSAPERSYKVFLHIFNEQFDHVVAQLDYIPRNWTYPTDIWDEGEYVDDTVTLDISTLSSGPYHVYAGLYDPETGERLETRRGDNMIWVTSFWGSAGQ